MRIAFGFLALAAVPVWLSVDLIVAQLRGWWTSSSMPGIVFGVSGTLLAAALAMLVTSRGRALLHRRSPGIVAMMLALALAWWAAESVVHAMHGDGLLFHRHTPETVSYFRPDSSIMPGVDGKARHTTNSLGVRGAEWPPRDEAYRVLCIGGSTTACLFLDDDETWPAILQEQLLTTGGPPVWVGDVGKSGYGTWHHVKFMGAADLLKQIDCAVLMVGINDLMRALQRRRIESSYGCEPIYERSAIFALFHNVYQARKQRRLFERELSDGSSYVERRRLRAERALVHELPDLAPGLAEYRTNLITLIAALRSYGVRPVFTTQPVLWHRDLPENADRLLWLGCPDDETALSVEALVVGMRQFNDALREVCAAEAVECIELSSMDGDVECFFDDCHFTEHGARRVGQLLAAWFRERGW